MVLTNHDLSDVEKLCNRVLIIDRGKLLYNGRLDSLQDRFAGKRELVVDMAESYLNVSVPNAPVTTQDGLRVTYQFERQEISASALISQLSSQFRIQDLSVREPDIEATIRRIDEERLLETSSI